jgi:glycosyltransferase involved in cell wall biosynthesis
LALRARARLRPALFLFIKLLFLQFGGQMSSQNTKRSCILVYNPISNHGHLDSWNAIFIALLLEKGWRVLALTPNVTALTSRLVGKHRSNSALQILDWNAHTKNLGLKASLRPIWWRWVAFGDMYLYRRKPIPDAPFLLRLRGLFFQAVIPFLFRATHYLYRNYIRGKLPVAVAAGSSDGECDLANPVEMVRRVGAALGRAKWQPALCFNMYMDLYRTKPEPWRQFETINTLPWVGIRFVPPNTPQEAWYSVPSLRGMCFLDENVCRAYQNALPDKHFEYLPDVTETALPPTSTALVQKIRRQANGRKVVFLGGSIGGQKNLARWYDLIALADPAAWFFVQVGEIHRDTLTADDIIALDRVREAPPANLLMHTDYLPDERAFNEIIAASDLIFAVYRNFPFSSNMPNKAAHFRKPILVSDRFLMGERVTHYGIGRAVAEDDAAAMLETLAAMVRDCFREESFARYCGDFSPDSLAERLDGFLIDCLEEQAVS